MNTIRANNDLVGALITVSGWGVTATSQGQPVTDLLKENQNIVETTATVHGHTLNKQLLLQGTQDDDIAICSGDSGGKTYYIVFSSLSSSILYDVVCHLIKIYLL